MMKRAIILSAAVSLAPVAFADSATSDAASPTVTDGAPAAWQPEDGDQISFKVLRKGKDFGTHVVDFDVDDDGTFTATTNVDLKAGLGPITMFRYELTAAETWAGGQLVALEGKTNDDGEDEYVSASREGGVLKVSGSSYQGDAPLGIIPSSHWNIKEVF
ncbi:MAG: DUF6134 family protein, partial [Henriciella sp.]|uniref:DUF6134 family protein n=1 Tax=Henriciella sp. TaxID=1968823 RepID=UPI003C7965C6